VTLATCALATAAVNLYHQEQGHPLLVRFACIVAFMAARVV